MTGAKKIIAGVAYGFAMTTSSIIPEQSALAQQFFVNPPSVTIDVLIDSRELHGQAGAFPEPAEWYSSEPQIAELSYPVYLHYRAPTQGMPHISHVIRVRCLQEGEAEVMAIPVDTTLSSATATVSCKEPEPQQPGQPPAPRAPQNVEDCTGPAAEAILKWTTPINNSNFPNCGTPNQCDVVRNDTICAAINSFVSIREDGKICSECHYRGSGSDHDPDVAQYATGGINRDDFAPGHADAFLTKDNPGSPAYKEAHLRALIQKWKDDGYQ